MMYRKMIVAALGIGFLAGTVHAQDVVWRRDWKQLPSLTKVTSDNLDGAASGPVDVGSQDFTVGSGPIRVFDLTKGEFGLIHNSNPANAWDAMFEITDVQYAPNTEYTMTFVIGSGASGANGGWFLDFGTMVGTNFTVLSSVDIGSASFSGSGTYNLIVDGVYSDLFGYSVGGEIIELTADPVVASLGQNVAIRFGVSSSGGYAGFSDMALTTSPSTNLVKKVELIILKQ